MVTSDEHISFSPRTKLWNSFWSHGTVIIKTHSTQLIPGTFRSFCSNFYLIYSLECHAESESRKQRVACSDVANCDDSFRNTDETAACYSDLRFASRQLGTASRVLANQVNGSQKTVCRKTKTLSQRQREQSGCRPFYFWKVGVLVHVSAKWRTVVLHGEIQRCVQNAVFYSPPQVSLNLNMNITAALRQKWAWLRFLHYAPLSI